MTAIFVRAKKGVLVLSVLSLALVLGVLQSAGGSDTVVSVSAAEGDPIYMKIDGIDGEATDRGHEGEIDLLSWSWGMSQTGSGHTGGGASSGKVSVHDLSITKHVDKSSTDLMLACASGKHFPNIKLTMRKAGGDSRDYLRYAFFDVFCTSYKVGGTSNDLLPTESLSLNFTKISMEYKEQTADGSYKDPKTASWDFAQNAK